MTNSIINGRKEIKAFADYLSHIVSEELSVFEEQFNKQLKQINEMSQASSENRYGLIKYCSKICAKEMDKSTMSYRCRVKPLGYAGDYLILDWIYTKKISTDYVGKLWDELYLRFPASQAVQNRKDHFCNLLSTLANKATNGISVLDIACGSCHDLADAIEKIGTEVAGSYFHCVDAEQKAIEYAKKVLRGNAPDVSFRWEVSNAFRLRTDRRYDLVWAAGVV